MSATKRIESLTAEQIAMMPEFRDKWIGIGLSCEPLDTERAKRAVEKVYRAAGLEPPQHIVVCDSPLSAAITASILKKGFGGGVAKHIQPGDSVWASVQDSVWASVQDSVQDSVWDSVRASVWASMWASVQDSVWDSVQDSVWDSVRASVWASVRASVWASMWASVQDSVWDSVRASVQDSVWEQIYGAHDSGWLSFYSYFGEVVGLECVSPLQGLIELAQCCGWWAPYKNVALLQHRHCELHRDTQGRLHNENGPAVKYRDGWCVYALNGVRVPEWLATTKGHLLDANKLYEIDNAEVRREFVRKIGYELLCQRLNARVIDSKVMHTADGEHPYELIGLKAPNNRGEWLFLKMTNPSIGTFHVEGVGNECKTVQDALNFRNAAALKGRKIAEDGADWYQHGDVIIMPRGAKAVKPYPAWIR